MKAICTQDITKKYKHGVQALNGLTITVEEGEIFALLGQNGAGKSTLIHILTTFLKPTSGFVTILGHDIYQEAAEIRRQISCVAQNTSIDTYLSFKENMLFQSRLYQIPETKARKRMDTLVSCFGLEQYLKYPVASCSGGVKRRLDIALNLMTNPKILFLDEPTVGMDIQSRMSMWEMMKKIRNEFGTTILLTTHYLEEADQLSDTICIMKNGKEIVQGTPYALRSYLRQDLMKIRFESKEEAGRCLSLLKDRTDLKETDLRQDAIIAALKNGHSDFTTAVRILLENDVPFQGIEILQPSLEDVFIRLTGSQEVYS